MSEIGSVVTQESGEEARYAVYAKLPRLNCKGLCAGSCGPIPLAPAEAHLGSNGGLYILNPATGVCPNLTPKKRCSIYDKRPLICRLWGMVKRMRCPYGCRPRRWVSDEEVDALYTELGLTKEAKVRVVEDIVAALMAVMDGGDD